MMIYNKGATRTAVQGALCYSSKAVLGMITTKYVVGKTPSMSGTSRPRCSCRNETAAHGGRFAMPVTKPCLNCGKPVSVKPSHAAKGAGKFCSRACMGAWATKTALGYDPAKRVVKYCRVCGKELHIKQSHAGIEGTYCSTACMAEGYSTVLIGAANPNYRHGMANTNEYRRASSSDQRSSRFNAIGTYSAKDIVSMMHHQNGECAACGKSLKAGYEVDHRVPLSRGGSNYVGNLQLLCTHCNRAKHNKFVIEFRYRK